MSNLRVTDLDFDLIKANLKEYLQSQAEFTDYDFEGSALSVLLDILAYNTHLNAYLANMSVNEMFLDSAIKRSSVTSLAKHLNYTPRSIRSAAAIVDITVTNVPNPEPVSILLNRFTQFTSSSGYTIYNVEPYTAIGTSGTYSFEDVTLKEGKLLSYSYAVSDPGPSEKYEIPNIDVDTTTLFVTVQTSGSDLTTTTYTRALDIVNVDSSSTVYFLEENTRGNFEIYFGDGIIGKQLAAGNIVKIQYLISSGSVVNVSSKLTQSFSTPSIGGSSSITITTQSNSTGGADRESIDSIKYNAPRAYSTQNRVITKSDYETLIRSNYTQIESVSAWGGEDNIPPVYGKVFISLKPYSGYVVDSALKNVIKNELLAPRKVMTITPEFVDPDYIFIKPSVTIKYNKNRTTLSSSQLTDAAYSVIVAYSQQNLQQFGKQFYYSELVEKISDVDQSIVSVSMGIKIQKRVSPLLNVVNTFRETNKLKFNNRLHPGEITSTRFYTVKGGVTYLAYIKDVPDDLPYNYDGKGELVLYATNSKQIIDEIGTVDYATGEIVINNLFVTGYPSGQFDVSITGDVQEESYDISTERNQIVEIDTSTQNALSGREQGILVAALAV